MAKTHNVNYCDLIGLQDNKQANPEQLWLQNKKRNSMPKTNFTYTNTNTQPQSKLLQSALFKIRSEKQRKQAEAIEDIISQSSSNFFLSRENTPANFLAPKKKNKHKTAGSDLFDIQSKGSENKKNDMASFQGLILYPHFIGLSQLVYAEVMGKQRKINNKLMHSWKDCLLPEDKQQIYGTNAPYSFSRVFPINQLQKGFNQIYGSGKKRCLKVGQQSLLLHHMDKYLQKCNKEITKIARKDFDIISDILKAAKLQQLEQMPICMKQIQLLWKILATQWRFSGKLDFKNRLLESALINGRSNFLDLRKQNAVTAFLLSFSNQEQKQV